MTQTTPLPSPTPDPMADLKCFRRWLAGVLAMLERTVSEREASTSRMKREHTGGEAHVERGRAQFLIDRMRQLFHR